MTLGPVKSPWSQSSRRKKVKKSICETGRLLARSERVRKSWIRRAANQQRKKRQVQEKVSQRQRNQYEVDREKQGVDSRDSVLMCH